MSFENPNFDDLDSDEEALQKLVMEAGFKARDITYSETPFSSDEI